LTEAGVCHEIAEPRIKAASQRRDCNDQNRSPRSASEKNREADLMIKTLLPLLAGTALALSAATASAATLDDVKAKGFVSAA
jgi:hypothetical protein